MKKLIIIVAILIVFIFVGCDLKINKEQTNEKIGKVIKEYKEKNEIKILGGAIKKDEEIILFENKDKYGVASFYINDKNGEIRNEISTINKSNHLEKIVYSQIKAKKNFYIGVFITDEKLLLESNQIEILYEESKDNNLVSTQVNIGEDFSQLIEYSSDKIMKIKGIKLLDSNSNEIYHLDY